MNRRRRASSTQEPSVTMKVVGSQFVAFAPAAHGHEYHLLSPVARANNLVKLFLCAHGKGIRRGHGACGPDRDQARKL